jgi:hypothetical protein
MLKHACRLWMSINLATPHFSLIILELFAPVILWRYVMQSGF